VSNTFKTQGDLTMNATTGALSGAGAITSAPLARGGSVTLSGANSVGGISGNASTGAFSFTAPAIWKSPAISRPPPA
jgi:hypothetical protein